MAQVIGHEHPKNILSKALAGDVPHHVFLFHGASGLGKRTLAESFALRLVQGGSYDAQWEIAEHVSRESDIMILAPQTVTKKGVERSSGITVDMVRDFRKRLSRTSQNTPSVIIIDQAHEMTVQAQNALLKIIEEPWGAIRIICVTSQLDALLPTICSRGMLIPFHSLGPAQMGEVAGVTQEILAHSFGRPGYARAMVLDQDRCSSAIEALGALKELGSQSLHEKFDLAAELSKDHVKAIATLELWILRIYAVAHTHKRYDVLLLAQKAETALVELRDRNTNKKLVLENLMLSL